MKSPPWGNWLFVSLGGIAPLLIGCQGMSTSSSPDSGPKDITQINHIVILLQEIAEDIYPPPMGGPGPRSGPEPDPGPGPEEGQGQGQVDPHWYYWWTRWTRYYYYW